MADNKLAVEVVYALPEEQTLLSIVVKKGDTVRDVILQSSILQEYPELDIDSLDVGLFGKATKMTQVVREKDRVEIYRPLIADPKEVRKRKAAEGKKLKKGGAAASENKVNK
jgi:putative ubiquitin-RnfH superfamily antitoxin RatB of RatAB toxin-antitoxin module